MKRERAGLACAIAFALLAAGCASSSKTAPRPEVERAPAPPPPPPSDFAALAALTYGDSALAADLALINGVPGETAIPPGAHPVVPATREELERRAAALRAEDAYNRATRLARAKRFTEAEAAYREALRERPEMHEAAYNLGVVLSQLGRSTESRTLLERAVELDGSNARYRYAWGSALRKAGKPADAERQFARAVELDGGYKDAVFALAATREALGKDATPLYKRYLELDPNGPWAEEARRRLRLGDRR